MKKNRLIAEFMQLPTEVFQLSGILNYGIDDSWYEEHELSYHKSWDWLMPVVSKCFEVRVWSWEIVDIIDTLPTCDIDIMYTQVVEFINQYNKNK